MWNHFRLVPKSESRFLLNIPDGIGARDRNQIGMLQDASGPEAIDWSDQAGIPIILPLEWWIRITKMRTPSLRIVAATIAHQIGSHGKGTSQQDGIIILL